jgi:hypothetical protein
MPAIQSSNLTGGDIVVTSLIVPILSKSRELLGGLVFSVKEKAVASTYSDSDLELGYSFIIQD